MYHEGKTYDFTLHDVVSKDKSTAMRTLSPEYYRDAAMSEFQRLKKYLVKDFASETKNKVNSES